MRRRLGGLLAALALISGPVAADVVLECRALVSAETLIEPWEETSRTFSRGSVRVAVVDLGEPPCCPQHIAVLFPANMYGGRSCALIARGVIVPNGWTKVGIDEAEATRPPGGGLQISVPVYGFDTKTGGADLSSRRVVSVRVRQAAGTVELSGD